VRITNERSPSVDEYWGGEREVFVAAFNSELTQLCFASFFGGGSAIS
jgi:hypothetical protein